MYDYTDRFIKIKRIFLRKILEEEIIQNSHIEIDKLPGGCTIKTEDYSFNLLDSLGVVDCQIITPFKNITCSFTDEKDVEDFINKEWN